MGSPPISGRNHYPFVAFLLSRHSRHSSSYIILFRLRSQLLFQFFVGPLFIHDRLDPVRFHSFLGLSPCSSLRSSSRLDHLYREHVFSGSLSLLDLDFVLSVSMSSSSVSFALTLISCPTLNFSSNTFLNFHNSSCLFRSLFNFSSLLVLYNFLRSLMFIAVLFLLVLFLLHALVVLPSVLFLFLLVLR